MMMLEAALSATPLRMVDPDPDPDPDPGPPHAPESPTHLFQGPTTFYHTILESLSEGVALADQDGRIRYANRTACSITGYALEELLGQDALELLVPDLQEMQEDDVESQPAIPPCRRPEGFCAEARIRRKNGLRHWVRLKTTPYRNESDQIAGTMVTMSCIQKLKELETENAALHDDLRQNFGDIIGESPAIQKVIAQIATVAPTHANVLILGESGTGKELVARAIHENSGRRDKPLVRVNCASIPRELFESEFFGHVRGAFTGAIKDRAGRFELADGGTLFMDEIGEIPRELQSKLLRVLQEGQFERLGDDRTRSVNVRIIAATNRDLEAEAKAGHFRLDLYYRLSVFPIELPPLRERTGDIASLADHFAQQAARRLGVPKPRLTRVMIEALERYDWPGNIRELQNVIERSVILARDGRLRIDLPTTSTNNNANASGGTRHSTGLHNASGIPSGARGTAQKSPGPCPSGQNQDQDHETAETSAQPLSLSDLAVREREILEEALRRTGGKIYGTNGAARLLGIQPTTLSSKIKRMGLTRLPPVGKER